MGILTKRSLQVFPHSSQDSSPEVAVLYLFVFLPPPRRLHFDTHVMPSVQELDARIRTLENEIRQLRTQRNAHMPLCRLPVELFVKIMGCVSWRHLLIVRMICKGVQNLVDNAHILWSKPPLAYQGVPDELADLFIRRSGCAPLSFWGFENGLSQPDYSPRQLNMIVSQLHRMKRL
jgi:hypothetical protein